MNLDKTFKMFKILEYIASNPNCIAPEIRDFLGIIHRSSPNKEEKEFYQLITSLDKEGYVYKVSIKKLGSGGAHFSLTISQKGSELMSDLREFSSKKLQDKGRYPDDKARHIVLDSMLRFFSKETVDIIEDLIDYAGTRVEGKFEDAEYGVQKDILDRINSAVYNIRTKASEIAESFF